MPNRSVFQGRAAVGFVYRSNGLSRGRPVLPRGVQDPTRGSFVDPRGPEDNGLSGYHFAIDVQRRRPPSRSQRAAYRYRPFSRFHKQAYSSDATSCLRQKRVWWPPWPSTTRYGSRSRASSAANLRVSVSEARSSTAADR